MPARLREAADRNCFCAKGAAPRRAVGWLAACGLMAAAVVALPETSRAEPDSYAPKWDPWAELGGYWGSDDTSHGLGELWAPLLQGPTALFFFDGRFRLFEEDVEEGNLALGLRKMTPSGWNLGIWGAADVRDTSADNTFWQVSGGLEALSVNWDFRVNGYVPVTDPQASPSTAKVKLKGNNIFMIGGEEVALNGVDGEIGYLLFGSPQEKPGTRYEFRVYGGGFWFDASDAIREVAGPKARIEWRIDDVIANWAGSRLTFDAQYSHDDVRDDLWEVGLRFRIPFGGTERAYAGLTPQERRMTERIERDQDIVTVESGPEKVYDTLTGVLFDRVAYVNPSISDTSAKAGDNSLLIVNGTVAGPQSLQGNQTLQGGASTINVTGRKSGITLPFTAPGAKATLVDPGSEVNLTLTGDNTHVAGLDIHGVPTVGFTFGNPAGISGPGPLTNVVIEQTSVADTGFAGISFGANNSNVRIFDTTVTNGGALGGITFLIDNSDVTISRVTVADTAGTGIFLGTGSRHVRISDTTVTGISLGSGIGIGSNANDVEISHVAVADIFSFGITASSNNTNVTISDSTVTDTGGDGLHFINSNRNVTIANTTVTNAGLASSGSFRNGIGFGSNNSNVTIVDTRVTNVRLDGIRFDNNNLDIVITETTVTNAQRDGVAFGNGNRFTISDTAVVDIGDDGVSIGSNNSMTLQNSTLAGTFGDNGIVINAAGNTLDGVGNTAAGATFSGDLCQDFGNPWTGTVVFDGVAITSANCP